MYRGLFLFVLEFFLFGINLYGWQSVGINHAHICDFKNKLCPLRVLEVRYRLPWGGELLIKPDITFKLSKHLFASFSGVFQRICVIFPNAPSWKWINHLKMSTLRFSVDAKHFEQALSGLVARRGEKWRVFLRPSVPPSPREVARRLQNILKTDLFENVDVAIIMWFLWFRFIRINVNIWDFVQLQGVD